MTSGSVLSYLARRLAIVCLAAVALSWTVFLLAFIDPKIRYGRAVA